MRRQHRVQRWTSALLCAGLLATAAVPAVATPQERGEDERRERREARQEQREERREARRAEQPAAQEQRQERIRAAIPQRAEPPVREARPERGPRPERQAVAVEDRGDFLRQQQARHDAQQREAMAQQRAGQARREHERAQAQRGAEQRAARERADLERNAAAQRGRAQREDHLRRLAEQHDVRGVQEQRDRGVQRAQRPQRGDAERGLAGQHGRDDRDDVRRQRADTRGDLRDARRISNEEQRRLIERQRLQASQWQRTETARRAQIERHARDLERQRRHAQYRYQQEYYRRWLAQQARWNRWNDYHSDPYYYTASNYRYGFGGQWFSTNRYGADMLRQAVRDGYQEGFHAGRADRMDGWRFDYRNAYAWMDGSYGYHGRYVSQAAYRHYFRQGFERGYRDAYYGRSQYGYYDGRSNLAVILPVVLSAILGFQSY